MTQLNSGRVWGAGLAAGVVMNVIDAITNGVLLGGRWRQEANALEPSLITTAGTMSTVGWIIVDFVLGILIVWTYAAIRPRFGGGPRTAMLAALVLWLATHAVYASYIFMGLFSSTLIVASSIGGLVAAVAGGYVGGLLYREA